MERNLENIDSLIKRNSNKFFAQFKKVKNFYSKNYIYVVLPKEGITSSDVKKELREIECGLSVEIVQGAQVIEAIHETIGGNAILFYASTQEEFDWLVDYHSYSNSIILGKMFKKAGLKFSDKGLQYLHKHIEPNHQVVIGTIDICKDYKKILEILDLSYSEYQNDIDSKEDLFKFFLKSPYLNSKKFVSDEKEYTNALMIDFERYLILNKIKNSGSAPSFEYVKSYFPEIDFDGQIKEFQERAERKKGINDKFNGRVILETIPGYQQKDLGHSIKSFKESFGSKEAYEEYVVENSQEQIIEKFKEVTMSV